MRVILANTQLADRQRLRLVSELRASAVVLYQRILSRCARHRWDGWEVYLQDYHRLVIEAYEKGLPAEIAPIQPLGQHRARGSLKVTNDEKRKILEILERTFNVVCVCDECLRASARMADVARDRAAALQRIESTCCGFHEFIMRLRNGHGKGPGLDGLRLRNEYDAQRLLRALLCFQFQDVRSEEAVPSFAGSSSRMDFLLMPLGIAIEVKMTRAGLQDSELGRQLLVDVARYRKHPDCKLLVCFIYDPERRVRNRRQLVRDIEDAGIRRLPVRVFVAP